MRAILTVSKIIPNPTPSVNLVTEPPDTHPTLVIDKISAELRSVAYCNLAKAKVLQTELANLKSGGESVKKESLFLLDQLKAIVG